MLLRTMSPSQHGLARPGEQLRAGSRLQAHLFGRICHLTELGLREVEPCKLKRDRESVAGEECEWRVIKRERETRLKDEKTVSLAEAVPFLLLPRQRLFNDHDRLAGPSGVPRQLCAVEDPQRAVREPRVDSIEDGGHRAEVAGFGRLPAGHEEEEAVKSREGQ
jgi:hypothetical protein